MKQDSDILRAVFDSTRQLAEFFTSGRYPSTQTGAGQQHFLERNDTGITAEPVNETAGPSTINRVLGNLRNTIKQIPKAIRSSRSTSPEQAASSTAHSINLSTAGSRKRLRGELSESSKSSVKKLKSKELDPQPPVLRQPTDRTLPRNQLRALRAKKRDGSACIVSKSMGAIEAAHIIPHAVNHSEQSVSFFKAMLPTLATMFGDQFATKINDIAGAVRASDQLWNLLTLSVYVHRLYDLGLIGFRPDKIAHRDNDGYYVYFSIHWLMPTKIRHRKFHFVEKEAEAFEANEESLRQMLELQDEARANREAYDLFHMRKREIVTDGTKISIHHEKLDQAQKMYDCLALSWAMRMMLFLAGAAGHPDGDYDHEPFARNWNEIYLVEDRECMDEVFLHYFWPKSPRRHGSGLLEDARPYLLSNEWPEGQF
ncbi:hypothetical protein BBO_00036 [Beauveria brongniartii RCEF 3172]|uniref:HNH nuclease domain-containing protein n=1 Tax=Beauveria brongniartii RCEF 3172 TaxID=1081107 RepID=A0A162I4I2_9HYPO|nr:hypothetical protein BBO_00036 [Beauveria brongniartii RCEF 3172]